MNQTNTTAAGQDRSVLKNFIQNYFERLNQLMQSLDPDAIVRFIEELDIARANGNTVFIIGNGGSAATASHMANDLGVNLYAKDPSKAPIKALSLTDNAAVMLAVANDEGYDNIFVCQLQVLFRPGDKLIAISASGNSPNVVKAAQWVRDNGGTVMSLVGFDGGELAKLSDICIHARTPKGQYGPVEDIHMIMDHLVLDWMMGKGR